eukprot:7565132-Alexandrium_andersonii.AAC.1
MTAALHATGLSSSMPASSPRRAGVALPGLASPPWEGREASLEHARWRAPRAQEPMAARRRGRRGRGASST